ncbi:MAG: DUF5947 family protein [Egibacteraceae bacterium]
MTARGLARFTAPASPATGSPDAIADTPLLARFLGTRQRPKPGEACEMCSEAVPDEHRHVVDLERRGLLCVCQGCSLLFMTSDSGQSRYRTVPDRFLRVDPFSTPQPAWASLQIPVGMAFVVSNTQLERTVAFYPSPGGATESELALDAWAEVVAANPCLEGVEPDVEAVLFRTGVDASECFVVPVDRCYELVGVLRLHWRGFDGGQEVRERIDAFFADVRSRSRPLPPRTASSPDRSPTHPPRSSAGALPRSPDAADDAAAEAKA